MRIYPHLPSATSVLSDNTLPTPNEFKEKVHYQQQSLFLKELPTELLPKFFLMLWPRDIFSLIRTCKAVYQYLPFYNDNYWKPKFDNFLSAYGFLKNKYDIRERYPYWLSELRSGVLQGTIQDIDIFKVIALYKKPPHNRRLNDLVEQNILEAQQLENVNLQPHHEARLLTDGSISVQLQQSKSLDSEALEALSRIPERYTGTDGVKKAFLCKKKEIIRDMVLSKVFINSHWQNSCETPLHEAVRLGEHGLAKALLKSGAQPSLRMKNKDGNTPIELAADDKMAQILNSAI